MSVLAGRVAVVTGAAGAIGSAVAERLASQGAQVLLLDRRQGEAAAGASILPCDVASEAEVERAFAALDGGPFDILVNCAGTTGPVGPLEACSLADLELVLAVNLRGSFLCCRAASSRMGRGGAIVNLASTAGLVGSARLGAYALSKAAVISMTRTLALTLAPRGIRVNAVAPGSIEGEMLDGTLRAADPDAERRAIAALHPLGRLGTAAEVADAVLFLAGPSAAFVTGTILPVDGGRLA